MSSLVRQLLFVAALVAPRMVAGQQAAALRSRADSLLREWQQASALAAVQDSLRHAASIAGRDTVRAGALTILVNPSPLPLARAAARAWPMIERFYGPAAQALARRPLVIEAVDPDTAVPPNPGDALQIFWDIDEDQLTRVLVILADLSSADPALRDWLGGAVTPGLDSLQRRAQVYVELVTAPSQAVRRCFVGDRTACRDALSLSDAPDLLTRWYGADERRLLVTAQYAGFLNKGGRAAEFHDCGAGSDSACLDLLESLPPGSLQRPLDYAARFALLETAIGLGGPETFHRLLLSPPGPMGARLATAALVTEDSLVARWHADILAARPRPVPLPPWGLWVALGWTAVFMTCGLGSSRWRVS
jgi:hypothetical protein